MCRFLCLDIILLFLAMAELKPVRLCSFGLTKKIIFLPLLLTFSGCSPSALPEGGELAYAQWLRMEEGEAYTVFTILDPWHEGEVLQRYVLAEEGRTVADTVKGIRISIPLQRAVCAATPHAHLAFRMGVASRLAGLMDAEYAVSDSLTTALSDGRLQNCGASLNPDIECIAALHPDALLLSPFAGSGYGALENMGIPIVVCADYMETSALGRAEWMRFYGRLFGCAEKSDSLFAREVEAYRQVADETKRRQVPRPCLMVDLMQGEAWYVPGAESYLGRLFEDAGFSYAFSKYKQAGSVALTLDEVYAATLQADCWIIRSTKPLTIQDIREADPRYAHFKALQQGSVWCCNTLASPYYDVLPFAPSQLLRELSAIAQGEEGAYPALQYFQKVK